MDITRRNLILAISATPLYLATFSNVYATEEQGWEETCRRWMHILVPSDTHGPGADCHQVWEKIDDLMSNDAEKGEWIKYGLSVLSQVNLPNDEKQIRLLLTEHTSLSSFLSYFNNFLIDSYYSSAAGWLDLGVSSPPLPKGFAL